MLLQEVQPFWASLCRLCFPLLHNFFQERVTFYVTKIRWYAYEVDRKTQEWFFWVYSRPHIFILLDNLAAIFYRFIHSFWIWKSLFLDSKVYQNQISIHFLFFLLSFSISRGRKREFSSIKNLCLLFLWWLILVLVFCEFWLVQLAKYCHRHIDVYRFKSFLL